MISIHNILLLATCASLAYGSPIAVPIAHGEDTSANPYTSSPVASTGDSYASPPASSPLAYVPHSSSIEAAPTTPTLSSYKPTGYDATQPVTTLTDASTTAIAAASPPAYGMGSGISISDLTTSNSAPSYGNPSTSAETKALSAESAPPAYVTSRTTTGLVDYPGTTSSSTSAFVFVPGSAVSSASAYGNSSHSASATSRLPGSVPASSVFSTKQPSYSAPHYGSSKHYSYFPTGHVSSNVISPVQSSKPYGYTNSSSTLAIPQHPGPTSAISQYSSSVVAIPQYPSSAADIPQYSAPKTTTAPPVSTAASATYNYKPVENSSQVSAAETSSAAPSYGGDASATAAAYSSTGSSSAAAHQAKSTTFVTQYTTVFAGGPTSSAAPSYASAAPSYGSPAVSSYGSVAPSHGTAVQTDTLSQTVSTVSTASHASSATEVAPSYEHTTSSIIATSSKVPSYNDPSTVKPTMTTTTTTTMKPVTLPSVVVPSAPTYPASSTSEAVEGITIVPVDPSTYHAYSPDAKKIVTVTVTQAGVTAKETVTVTAPCSYRA